MISNFSVKEFMRKSPITLHPKDDISKAKDLFAKMDIHHLPVVVNNKITGIISLGDLLFLEIIESRNMDKFLATANVGVSKIDDIMTINTICINEKENMKTALKLMIDKRINCLPVINDIQDMVGLITTTDILLFIKNKITN